MCWGRQGLQEQAEGARCESKTACNKSTNATTCTIPASLREGGGARSVTEGASEEPRRTIAAIETNDNE